MTAGARRSTLAAWLQSDDARAQAHSELRHLGLPTSLADDLLADAAYRLTHLVSDDAPEGGQGGADGPDAAPAYRALTAAARRLLRARRNAADEVPAVDQDAVDLALRLTAPHLPAPDLASLGGGPALTDRRRRILAALAADRPHDLAAALTVLTLATEPTLRAALDPARADHVEELTAIALGGSASTSTTSADAIGRVLSLLAETLLVEAGGMGSGPGLVDRTTSPADPSVDGSTTARVRRSATLLHRRTAHG